MANQGYSDVLYRVCRIVVVELRTSSLKTPIHQHLVSNGGVLVFSGADAYRTMVDGGGETAIGGGAV